MPTYTYRCSEHGPVDVRLALGAAPGRLPCPDCAAPSARVWGAPGLALVEPSLRRVLDGADRSRDAPQVVSAPPARARRASTPAPAWSRLPRP